MLSKLLWIFIISFHFAAPKASASCSCDKESRDWKREAKIRSHVFSAKVEDVSNKRVILKIAKSFKGEAPIQLVIPEAEMPCSLPPSFFKKDTTYIFANDKFWDSKGDGPIFRPGICAEPPIEKDSPEIVKWLSSKDFKKTTNEKK